MVDASLELVLECRRKWKDVRRSCWVCEGIGSLWRFMEVCWSMWELVGVCGSCPTISPTGPPTGLPIPPDVVVGLNTL